MSKKQNKALVLHLYEEFDKGTLDDVAESIGSEFVANVLGRGSRADCSQDETLMDQGNLKEINSVLGKFLRANGGSYGDINWM